MVNIKWPDKKHWRTRQLINENPVLTSTKDKDTVSQTGILCCELYFLKCIDTEEFRPIWSSYKQYKTEVQQAFDQLP